MKQPRNAPLEHLIPPITGLCYDATALGRAAFAALAELLGGGAPASSVLPGYRLIERESTR